MARACRGRMCDGFRTGSVRTCGMRNRVVGLSVVVASLLGGSVVSSDALAACPDGSGNPCSVRVWLPMDHSYSSESIAVWSVDCSGNGQFDDGALSFMLD